MQVFPFCLRSLGEARGFTPGGERTIPELSCFLISLLFHSDGIPIIREGMKASVALLALRPVVVPSPGLTLTDAANLLSDSSVDLV